MKRLLLIFGLALAFLPFVVAEDQPQNIPEDWVYGLYDNGGGFAHDGHSIRLFEGGDYTEKVYTDTSEPDQPEKHGHFKLDGDKVLLLWKGGKTRVTYFLVLDDSGLFLLTEKERKEYLDGGKKKPPYASLKKQERQ